MGKFRRIDTDIEDVCVIEPTVFGDSRGYFMETYNIDDFKEIGINESFVQDNQSKSKKGVLRGLHFQKENVQGKLVRVVRGRVYDVAVDLRRNSKTFGKWVGVELSEENKKMLYIPPYFAHGFIVLSDDAEFTYKCTDVYNHEAESGILYNDPEINIEWPEVDCEILTSEKDTKWQTFEQFKNGDIWK